jgi:hypothetical protein
VALCQRDNFIAMGMKKSIAAHQESVRPRAERQAGGMVETFLGTTLIV